MKRKLLAGFLLLVMLVGMLSGCDRSQSPDEPETGAASAQSLFQISVTDPEPAAPEEPTPASPEASEAEDNAPIEEAEPEPSGETGFWHRPTGLTQEPAAPVQPSPTLSGNEKPEPEPIPEPEPTPEPEPVPAPEPEPEPAPEPIRAAPVVELYVYNRYESDSVNGSYISLLESTYHAARLSEQSARDYPQLAEAMEQYARSYVQTMTEELDEYTQWATEQIQWLAEDPDRGVEDFVNYSDDSTLTVFRADSQAVSMLRTHFAYIGGVHPDYWYDCENYDVQTGRSLALSAVISDLSALPAVLEPLLTEQYGDIFFNLHEDLSAMDWEDSVWVLGPDGITFYFSPYVLSFFAAGAQMVTLNPRQYPDLFTSAYRDLPREWAVTIPLGEEFSFHDTSGGYDTVYAVSNYDSYGSDIDSITVRWNGLETTIPEVYCYDATPVLMCSADYGAYLYLDCLSDNDYHILFVVSPGDNGPRLVETASTNGFGYRFDPDTYCTVQAAITSPRSFLLTRRCQLLSSYTVTAEFHMGPQGLPVAYDPHFPILAGYTLTTLRELTFPLVEESGQLTGQTVTLPTGSRLSFAYTDCETYVDLRLFDDRLCRVEVSREEPFNWPLYIQGYKADECFDGMMFAG